MKFRNIEQYSRRNYLLLHSIPESRNEKKTDDFYIAMMNELFELSVTEDNLEHIHGIGKLRNAS